MSTTYGVFTPGTSGGFGGVNWEIGYDFTVGSSIQIDGLLAFHTISQTWAQNKTVNIWDSGGSLVATGTIPAATGLYSGTQASRIAITPVTLVAGTYRISVNGYNGGDDINSSSGPPNPNITYNLRGGDTSPGFSYAQYYNTTANSRPTSSLDTTQQVLAASFTYSASASPSLTCSPTTATVVDGSTTATINATLTGSSASLTIGLSGAGSISATSGTSVTYTPPSSGSGTATVTFTDATDSLTAHCTITYAPPSSIAFAGPLTLTSSTPSGGNVFTWPAATGGTGTATYKLYSNPNPLYTHTQSGSTLVGTTTSLTLTDASPGSSPIYYLATVTDVGGTGTVAESFQFSTSGSGLQPYFVAVTATKVINFPNLGDSITYGEYASSDATKWPTVAGKVLAQAMPDWVVNYGGSWNKGVSGTTSSDWVNGTGGASLATVTGAIVSGQVNPVSIMLGVNDAQSGNQFSKATYKANILTLCNAIISAGGIPFLFAPSFVTQGDAAWTETNLHPLLLQYRDALIELANGTTIFLGAANNFELLGTPWQNGTQVIADYVHPTDAGYALLGNAAGCGLVRGLSQYFSLANLSPGSGQVVMPIIRRYVR